MDNKKKLTLRWNIKELEFRDTDEDENKNEGLINRFLII